MKHSWGEIRMQSSDWKRLQRTLSESSVKLATLFALSFGARLPLSLLFTRPGTNTRPRVCSDRKTPPLIMDRLFNAHIHTPTPVHAFRVAMINTVRSGGKWYEHGDELQSHFHPFFYTFGCFPSFEVVVVVVVGVCILSFSFLFPHTLENFHQNARACL